MNRCNPFQKAELCGRKAMLCVWYDYCGIIHFKFLNSCRKLNANSQQLPSEYENLFGKWPALVTWRNFALLLENIKPYPGKIPQKKIFDLTWSVYFTPSTIFIWQCTKFFLSNYKMLWITKLFPKKIRWKRLWKTSWARK